MKKEKKIKFIKDNNHSMKDAFIERMQNKLDLDDDNTLNVKAQNCGVYVNSLKITSFGDVDLYGCNVYSDTFLNLYSHGSVHLNGEFPIKDYYFYIDTNGTLDLINNKGFTISPFGLGEAGKPNVSLNEENILVISSNDTVNVYTSAPTDFMGDNINLMGDTELNVYYNNADLNIEL